jgi:hypothetical protein
MSDSIEAVLRDTYAAGIKQGALAYAENVAKLIRKEAGRYKGMDGQEAARGLAKSIKDGTAAAAEQLKGEP